MNEKTELGDKRLSTAIKTLQKKRYDITAMETLFTLEAEELDQYHDGPDTFDPSEFMKITRYVFRELNNLMVALGMYDKGQADKIRFNQHYIENCNAITTELLTQSARRDIEAINRLSLILHDYLSPYAEALEEKKKEEPKDNVVTTETGPKDA